MKDENSDLQKQIGCISGFFQLFDRHRFLTDQSSGSHSQKTQNRPTSGPGILHFNFVSDYAILILKVILKVPIVVWSVYVSVRGKSFFTCIYSSLLILFLSKMIVILIIYTLHL